MSKALAILFTGAGTATVGVGGVYLVKGSLWGGKDSEEGKDNTTPGASAPAASPSTTTPKTTTTKTGEEFVDTLDKFKSQKTDPCLKDLFTNVDFSSVNTEASGDSSTTVDADFLGTSSNDGNKTKGCLSIKWETKKGEESKWSGTFAWSWAFVNDTKGFIVFTVAKTNSSSELNLTGGVYLLEKEGDGTSNWKIKHSKEVKDTEKKISSAEFATKFPKAKSDNSVIKQDNKNYWGFIENENNPLENASSTVTGTSNSLSKKWLWKWVEGGDKKISDWSEDLEWWNHVYTKDFLNLSSKLDSFTGTWSKEGASTPAQSQDS